MHLSHARWATAVATVALIALPISAVAQSNPPQNPPSQPPTQTQPQTQPPATQQQPPSSTTQSQPAAPPANGQADAAAAKQHLTEARDALSQMTSMPEAAKLQGEARTKISELISNFNALITTQNDWRSAYGKVNDSLTALLGPDSDQSQSGAAASGTAAVGTAGTTGTGATAPTGTSGTAAASGSVNLDPALRAKLVEFRTHLKEFEKAAGGSASAPAPASSETSPSTAASAGSASAAGSAGSAAGSAGSMPPAASPTSTANPANPANPATATGGAVGTSGSESPKPFAGSATGSADQNVNAAAQQEIAAIDAIMKKSKTGALTKTQAAEIRRHLEALRSLLNSR